MINQTDISISDFVSLPDHCLHSKLMKSISKSEHLWGGLCACRWWDCSKNEILVAVGYGVPYLIVETCEHVDYQPVTGVSIIR